MEVKNLYLAKTSKGGVCHQHHQFQKGLLWDTKITLQNESQKYILGHFSKQIWVRDMEYYSLFMGKKNQKKKERLTNEWCQFMVLVNGKSVFR